MSVGPHAGEGDRIFDHHELNRAIHAAASRIAAVGAESSPRVVAVHAAEQAVEHLVETLEAHFRFEESASGFFAEIIGAAPRFSGELAALRAQHPDLARRMADLADRVRWAGLSKTSWQRAAAEFEAFVQSLENHEAAEDALVADALLADDEGA